MVPVYHSERQKIERIQKKMCKLIYDLRSLTYQEKLKKLKLLTLRTRRIQHQLTLVFKMKNKIIDLPFDDFFRKSSYNRTRGNVLKLMIPKSKTKCRKNFFTCSIVKFWNLLKSSDINCKTIHSFKVKTKKFFLKEEIW